MSLTYSDFLYTLPPVLQEASPAVIVPSLGATGTGIDRSRSRTMSSSETIANSRSSISMHTNEYSITNVGSYSSLSSSISSSHLVSTYLPNEFQVLQTPLVPLLPNFDLENQDFIIIAEFSELKGPIPISTIPTIAGMSTDVDLNNLCLHLLTTDYQVNTVGQFGICEDTQVLRTNVFQGLHVFMEYFTLFDIKARGFVRPFCFGYVSKDHLKLNKIVSELIPKFNQVSRMLKYTNREWFVGELTEYLTKLDRAKMEIILYNNGSSSSDFRGEPNHQERVSSFDSSSEDEDIGEQQGQGDENEKSNKQDEDVFRLLFNPIISTLNAEESISLNQIAQQYTEIENICKIVNTALKDEEYPVQLRRLENLSETGENGDKFFGLFLKFNTFCSTEKLDVPLAHPLKAKGEPLRSLSCLGQRGTLIFLHELLHVYHQYHCDSIYSELEDLTEDFRVHFNMETSVASQKLQLSKKCNGTDDEVKEIENILRNIQECVASINSAAEGRRSESYFSLSSGGTANNETASSTSETSPGSAVAKITPPDAATSQMPSSSASVSSASTENLEFSDSPSTRKGALELDGFLLRDMDSSWTVIESRDEILIDQQRKQPQSNFLQLLEIEKKSLWDYSSRKLARGIPGFGIRKFWLKFSSIAHHLLYSLLIGRPVVIFGPGSRRLKVEGILMSLIPLLPFEHGEKMKLIPWHQGILLYKEHLKGQYKMIGLCIPEKATVHDLVEARDQNGITLLDVKTKKIFGPAYSGMFLRNLKAIQDRRILDDSSLLTIIGTCLMEIECASYQVKALLAAYDIKISKEMEMVLIPKICKELQIKNSDVEIIRHVCNYIKNPQDIVNIF